ncbi:MAG: succinyl-CoA synthetase subunit alpha [Candidatus Aenigmarchaeota archaeon]|nr:succinyl-CoA synthetase subunit alpha [Candidatus Aenigmarchaeota archaeon]
MNTNYEYYLKADVGKFIGEWIAIVDGKIVAHSSNVKKTYEEAKKKYPSKRPLITRVPDKETMIF